MKIETVFSLYPTSVCEIFYGETMVQLLCTES